MQDIFTVIFTAENVRLVVILGAVICGFVWQNSKIEKRFNEVDKRFSEVDKRFLEMDAKMERGFSEVDKRFLAMAAEMDKRFLEVDKRFLAMAAEMNKRFLEVDNRFDKLKSEMMEAISVSENRLNARIDTLKFDLNTRIDTLKYNDFSHLSADFGSLCTAFKSLTFVLERQNLITKEDKAFIDYPLTNLSSRSEQSETPAAESAAI